MSELIDADKSMIYKQRFTVAVLRGFEKSHVRLADEHLEPFVVKNLLCPIRDVYIPVSANKPMFGSYYSDTSPNRPV
ncbi:MAG: hypothetical protein ACYS6K_07605 [Planctomycetota bacterium]|jgi:hypothetical protein